MGLRNCLTLRKRETPNISCDDFVFILWLTSGSPYPQCNEAYPCSEFNLAQRMLRLHHLQGRLSYSADLPQDLVMKTPLRLITCNTAG